ncbi:MAG: hypothetical protein R3C68_10565 [Myxococcota bacterium]
MRTQRELIKEAAGTYNTKPENVKAFSLLESIEEKSEQSLTTLIEGAFFPSFLDQVSYYTSRPKKQTAAGH